MRLEALVKYLYNKHRQWQDELGQTELNDMLVIRFHCSKSRAQR